MDTEKYQKELFEFEQPKKPKHRFANIFQKTDYALNLTAEKMVFVAIGAIMIMVICFALGVERGKSIALKAVVPVKAAVPAASAPLPVRLTQASIKTAPVPVKAAITTNIAVKTKVQAPVTAATDAGKPYTVVAGTFSKEDFAQKEASRLKAGGIEAFVIFSDPYYLACTGAFPSKESAQATLNRVRKLHRDAYIRLR